MTTPHDQSQYQVRFDWGPAGAEAVGSDADVVVLVDVLAAPEPENGSGRSALLDISAWPDRPSIVAGSLRNRTAVADWVLARQAEKGDRFAVAVIAAGEARTDGSIRFAVEDHVAAGAIIDALATVGIDYCSPEAAAACASFTGLRNALAHLVSASASGKALPGSDAARVTEFASQVDASADVSVLKE
ncbi:MAG: 2-phosphosulfolactate phosphatase [Terrimesophilobacter sp.]